MSSCKEGVYLYDAKEHALIPAAAGDSRALVMAPRPAGGAGGRPAMPAADRPPSVPVLLVLVSDISRFRSGSQELRLEWAAIDTGIVSQNISLFCAAAGLATRPRASMDREKIRSLLKLKDTQYPLLNHPVGHGK